MVHCGFSFVMWIYAIKVPPDQKLLVSLDVEDLLGSTQITLSLEKLFMFFSIGKRKFNKI